MKRAKIVTATFAIFILIFAINSKKILASTVEECSKKIHPFKIHIEENFSADLHLIKSILKKADEQIGQLCSATNQSNDLIIISIPENSYKVIDEMIFLYAKTMEKKLFVFEKLITDNDDDELVEQISTAINQSKSSVITIKNGDLIKEKAQKFILDLINNSGNLKISHQTTIVLLTSAGQALLQMSAEVNQKQEEQIKEALRLEGVSETFISRSLITFIAPISRLSLEKQLQNWIDEEILNLKKRTHKNIVIKDKKKMVDVILYHFGDISDRVSLNLAKKEIQLLINKGFSQFKNKKSKNKVIEFSVLEKERT